MYGGVDLRRRLLVEPDEVERLALPLEPPFLVGAEVQRRDLARDMRDEDLPRHARHRARADHLLDLLFGKDARALAPGPAEEEPLDDVARRLRRDPGRPARGRVREAPPLPP